MGALHRVGAYVLGSALLGGCGKATWTPQVTPVAEFAALGSRAANPSLDAWVKAHLRSGAVAVLQNWRVEANRTLVGAGARYGPDRLRLDSGLLAIPLDSIVLVEMRSKGVVHPVGLTGLAVWTTLTGALAIYCLADPKACFGSCPTFYVLDGEREVLQAEGFSASVARVFEARDVDAVYRTQPAERRFVVRVRNEALETHAVRSVRVLAVPRPDGGRVFAGSDGRLFFPARLVRPPVRCVAPEGDCLPAVSALDTLERRSRADSADLATRETMELEFPATEGRLGLVLGARQAFISTFLFYQTIAYLGRSAGEWLAALERGGSERAAPATGLMRVMGGVEVEVARPDGGWQLVGVFDEPGPMAGDVVVVPLPTGAPSAAQPLRVRLRMAKGHWRLNYVAVAVLDEPLPVIALEPVAVERGSEADTAALAALRDTSRYLVTYPGDDYRLEFRLPAHPERLELFLESRGYYYEWMRAEWLAEEDPAMAALILTRPEEALQRLAPRFKAIEDSIERQFWASRFGR